MTLEPSMGKLIVILVLTDQLLLTTAVETKAGLVAATFPNTEAAADNFFKFVEPLVAQEQSSYTVCLVHVGGGDYGFVGSELVAEGVKPWLLASDAFRDYVMTHGLDPTSPTAAARACIDVFKVLGPQRF